MRYASSPDAEVTREGWLLKRSDQKPEYHRRFCVLKGNLLFIFERKMDREPLAALLLEGCRIELEDHETQLFAFRIVFAPPTCRQFVFCTDSQNSLESWMKCLSTCSISILRMVVCELRRELSDIERENQLLASRTSSVTTAVAAAAPSAGWTTRSSTSMITPDSIGTTMKPRMNPFDEQNLIDLDEDRTSNLSITSVPTLVDRNVPMTNGSQRTSDTLLQIAQRQDRVMFSRRPFIELHHYYGLQFAQYFERRQKPKSVDELLLL